MTKDKTEKSHPSGSTDKWVFALLPSMMKTMSSLDEYVAGDIFAF